MNLRFNEGRDYTLRGFFLVVFNTANQMGGIMRNLAIESSAVHRDPFRYFIVFPAVPEIARDAKELASEDLPHGFRGAFLAAGEDLAGNLDAGGCFLGPHFGCWGWMRNEWVR